jgi:hypothetical protein
MEIKQPNAGSALTIKAGATTLLNVVELDFTGASISDGGGGIADIAILYSGSAGVVIHSATAGTARPTGYATIIWIGSVEPTNAENNDIWITTA